MPVNPKTGQRYRISDDGKNRLHIYGSGKTARTVKLARPKGYLYNPKNTQYYKIREDKGGLTRQHVYQSGRVVNAGAGSAFRKSGIPAGYYDRAINTWNVTNQPTINTLTRNRGRERAAQNQAYDQIAGYYAGLGDTTKNLMSQANQVGQATDSQVRQIGSDRDQSIRTATPTYGGPLGMVAQNMADAEQQAALNRGASADAANRTYGVQTSGNRQALMGQVGAGQAIAGQERLSTMKGQGNQALLSYTDKINEIEGQKPAKVLDTARQMQYDDQALGLKQYGAETDRLKALKPPAPKGGSNKSSGNQSSGSKGKPKKGKGLAPGASPYGATAEANRTFWNTVSQAIARVRVGDKNGKHPTYNQLVGMYNEPVAAVVRSLLERNGKLTPYAVDQLHRATYSVNGKYPVLTGREQGVWQNFPWGQKVKKK